MKKLFQILAIAAIVVSCSKDEIVPVQGTYTLTGYTNVETKTDFGTPAQDGSSIPFEWSAGDKIWSNGAQSGAAEIDANTGKAVFSFTTAPGSDVYYNMTGSSNQANVPAAQSTANNLGANGDFGYATVSNGSFTLEHATAYLWFDVTSSIANATLEWVKVDAADADIAGKATWNGTAFGSVTDGSKTVTLTVNQTLAPINQNVWAMVVLPADLSGKEVKVTYKLTVGGADKYYKQTFTEKSLTAGKTQKITTVIAESDLTDYMELRVLTFEDGTQMFNPFIIKTYCYDTYGSGDYEVEGSYQISKWSDLIPTLQKADPLNYGTYDTSIYYDIWSCPLKTDYYWSDENNTFLKHNLLETEVDLDWDGNPDAICRTYRNGGHAISNFKEAVVDEDVPSGYTQDWSEVMLSLPIDARSGSNFCVHNGYSQNEASMHSIEFSDGIARVIDHMYVTNTSYVLHSLKYGDSFNTAAVATTWFKLTAIGYNGTTKVGSVDFLLCDGSDGIVETWEKFELHSLGKVTSVKFTLSASEDQCDSYLGLNTPGYFAYDDVAVRF